MRSPRSDDASSHVLHAVIMASIMIGGVAFVVDFQSTGEPSAYDKVSEIFNKRTQEFVDIAFDWPLPDSQCLGDTKGDEWLSAAARGERSAFRDDMNRSYRDGVKGNLLFQNGYGELYLHHEHDNPALAGYTKSYEPNWTGAYVLPSLGVATGAETVEINSAAVVKSELQMQKGDGIEILVTFEDGQQKRVYASTAMLGAVWEDRAFAQNLTLSSSSQIRYMVLEIDTVHIVDGPTKEARKIILEMNPGPAGTSSTPSVLPSGTTIALQLPAGWYGADFSATAEEWSATAEETAGGLIIEFELEEEVASDQLIAFEAYAPTLPTIPFDVITADVYNGALAHAEFIVDYPLESVDKSLPRTVHASIPYPVRAGTPAILGVGVANAGNDTAIQQIDIMLPGGFDLRKNNGQGAELFANGDHPEAVSGTANGGVWKRIDARHLQWKGPVDIDHNDALGFLVSVNITEDLGEATSIEGDWTPRIITELDYENGYMTSATGWGSTPGFTRTIVRPDALTTLAADGYPFTELVGTETFTYDVAATIETPAQTLEGATSYTILPGTSDLGNVQSALGNASVHVSERVAPLGSLVAVEYDVSSLITTLADEGVGGLTLSTELYTPASRGCGPTQTWTRDASTLPIARATDMTIFDDVGLGTPGLFLASEDMSTYKVSALGITAWSQPHGILVSAITAGSTPSGPRVFTGATNGSVFALDASLAGEVDWNVEVPGSVDQTGFATVRKIDLHPTNGRLLVQTDQVVTVLDAQTGALLGWRDTGDATDTIHQADWDANGGIVMLTTKALERLDASAALKKMVGLEGAMGFAIAPVGIIVASPNEIAIRDPITLSPPEADATIHPTGSILLTTAGDATGDDVIDLVVALDTLEVKIVSGVTGAVVASFSDSLGSAAEFGIGVPNIGPIWMQGDSIVIEGFDPRMMRMECDDQGLLPSTYDLSTCVSVYDPNNLAPVPLLVEADGGRILYSYRIGAIAKTIAWHDGTVQQLDIPLDMATVPTSIAMGDWTLGTWAFVVAMSDGKIWTFTEEAGLAWTAEPTAMTGKFTFTLRVPMGGFFGTNILISRIQWVDPVFGPREVVIPEWFQVVAPDGTPVLSPWYELSALIELQDMPMTPGAIGP